MRGLQQSSSRACFNWTFIPSRICPVLLNLSTELTLTYILLSKPKCSKFHFYSSSGYFAQSNDWHLPRGHIGTAIHLHALLTVLLSMGVIDTQIYRGRVDDLLSSFSYHVEDEHITIIVSTI